MSVFRHSSHVCSCPIFSYPSLANRRRRIHVRQSGRGGVGNWWNQHEVNARARRAPINAATKTIDSESTSVTERVRSFTLAGPPDVYNHREDIRADGEWAVQQYPEIADLIGDGIVAVMRRPADYVERRTDGYQEPEVVFVVGSDHWSDDSAVHVDRVIRAVRPECVVVELCRSRVALLYASESPDPKAARMSNPVGITGSNPALALLRSARLGGQSGLLLQSVVGLFYGAMSRGLSRTPGAEMRAARAAAEDVGAEIVLGDRPVEITLRRAMGALGLGQRVSLVGMLARGAVTGPPEGFKEAMDEARAAGGGRAGGSGVLADLATVEGVPGGVASALLHERDLYLAWSMRRSKAVNGTRAVVGVVGAGHLRGIVYASKHYRGDLRFRDLVEGRNIKLTRAEQAARAARVVVRELAIAVAIGAAWWAITHQSELGAHVEMLPRA